MCAASVHTCHGVCAPYYTPPPPADEWDRTRYPSSRAAAAVLTAALTAVLTAVLLAVLTAALLAALPAALVEVLTVMVALLRS